ncbi:MAG: lamin tail domain-containing protein [Chloroflexi bacterium]|nr:lamin tail domain-containing protein [Chloroflexota bacterium]
MSRYQYRPSRRSTLFVIIAGLLVASFLNFNAYASDFDIVISEVMFNPACEAINSTSNCGTGTTEVQFEWVEIFNKGATTIDLTGWAICDKAGTGCDSLSGSISPGEYQLIAYNSTYLAQELANYTSAGGSNIFIANSIGSNGLSNSADAVFLLTGQSTCGSGNNLPCVSDCVSWDGTSTCATIVDDVVRAYLSGADGASNTSLNSAADGQSIVNVQGTWYQSGPVSNAVNQASPYSSNVAEGGSPTAVSLQSFTSANSQNTPLILLGMILVILLGSTAVLHRRQYRFSSH